MSLFQVSCEKKPKTGYSSTYEESVAAIDKGDFDRAIKLMEGQVRAKPNDQRSRVLLASAYGAKGGMFIRRFVDFAREIIESSKRAEELFNNRARRIFEAAHDNNTSPDQINIYTAMEKVFKAQWRLSDILNKFDVIPIIHSQEQQINIQKAVEVLSEDPNLVGSAALYRGLLRLTLFRHNVSLQAYFSDLTRCKVNFYRLSGELTSFYRELRNIMVDVAQSTATIEKRERLWEVIFQTDENVQDAVKWLQRYGATPVDVGFIIKKVNGSCE